MAAISRTAKEEAERQESEREASLAQTDPPNDGLNTSVCGWLVRAFFFFPITVFF